MNDKLTKSEAKKEYWSSKSKEDRSNHMRMMAVARHDTMSVVEKEKLIQQLQYGKRQRITKKGN